MDISGFKPIEGFDGRYMIDCNGNILSMFRYSNQHKIILEEPKYLHPMINTKGYKWVCLYKGSRKPYHFLVHRLVALTFLDNPENKRCVCHKDNNKLNCKVENLYWGTDLENLSQAIDDGLIPSCPVAKLDMEGNILDVYLSQSEAGKLNNIKSKHIYRCVNNIKRKTAYGFKWKRITKAEYEHYIIGRNSVKL